ncbi:hypothetical protein G7054_g7834 [Neopestalotiopsis clavispora]|nr:hypothetical protein G7054_g7834 [Neopestalotiopsis clavispora]
MPSDVRATRAHPGVHCFKEKDFGYINSESHTFRAIRSCHAGVEVLQQYVEDRVYKDHRVKVGIPSQLAKELESTLSYLEHNCVGGRDEEERARYALNQLISKCDGDCVLLDITTNDEESLRNTMGTDTCDIAELLCRSPGALPKAYKDWVPDNTDLDISDDGFMIKFCDSRKRALIKVIVGGYKEKTPSTCNNRLDTAMLPQRNPTTPQKRKTNDARHSDRMKTAPGQDSSANPFKQPKIESELSIEVKRAPTAEHASTSTIDVKVYDPRKIRAIPGGIEMGVNSDEFGNHSSGLTAKMMAVPSDLAKRIRDRAINAANSNDASLGRTPSDRAQAAVREMMLTWDGDCILLGLTSQEEDRILVPDQGCSYTSVGYAIRAQPRLLLTITMYDDWNPRATTLERTAEGNVTIMFKDYSGRTLMGVWIKELIWK